MIYAFNIIQINSIYLQNINKNIAIKNDLDLSPCGPEVFHVRAYRKQNRRVSKAAKASHRPPPVTRAARKNKVVRHRHGQSKRYRSCAATPSVL
jgi:hypothetical protein